MVIFGNKLVEELFSQYFQGMLRWSGERVAARISGFWNVVGTELDLCLLNTALHCDCLLYEGAGEHLEGGWWRGLPATYHFTWAQSPSYVLVCTPLVGWKTEWSESLSYRCNGRQWRGCRLSTRQCISLHSKTELHCNRGIISCKWGNFAMPASQKSSKTP